MIQMSNQSYRMVTNSRDQNRMMRLKSRRIEEEKSFKLANDKGLYRISIEQSSSTATEIIVICVWVLNDIGSSAFQRLLKAIPSSIPTSIHGLSSKLHRVEISLILHHLREGLHIAHLSHTHLGLSGVPVHDQMWVIIEDYGRNQVITAQIANEIDSGMTSYLPFMPSHRTTDVQSKQNSVVLNLNLHGLIGRHLGHVVHHVNVGIVHRIDWSFHHACISPDSMKHLPDICMSDIMVLAMYARRCHQISQRLSILILNIHSQNDYFKVTDIHISPEHAEGLIGLLDGCPAIGIMSISDEDMHEEPVVGSGITFQDRMQLHHEVVSIEQGVTHGRATMRVDVPDLTGS